MFHLKQLLVCFSGLFQFKETVLAPEQRIRHSYKLSSFAFIPVWSD